MNVPLTRQKYKLGCGAAALSMVMQYFGDEISEKDIVKYCGGFKSYGLKTTDLARFAREKGYKVECLTFNLDRADGMATLKTPKTQDIIRFLKKNIPVIINVNVSALRNTAPNNRGHFLVINDYKNGRFYYNDPSRKYGGKFSMNYDSLLFAWFTNVLDSSAYFLAIWK